MSYARRMTRPDSTQKTIVDALRKAGIKVWVIGQPCDLLTYYPAYGRWKPLECKPEKKRKRTDQPDQESFLEATGVPIVRTPTEAIVAVIRG